MDNEIRIQANHLQHLAERLFAAAGMNQADAEFASFCIVKTNLMGVDSHGIMRMPIYLQRLTGLAVNPMPQIRSLRKENSPVGLYDGDAGLGFIVGRAGMEAAIDRAKQWGIGFVLTKNSNHYGAASLYAKQAAEKGLIGITATNVIPNIGLKGNKSPSTGNNPIALAAPTIQEFPFVLDISMSAVAGGKLLLAEKKGEKIPKDWAVTKEGEETDDPRKGFEGFLLAMGMHKGFGLSLFIDLITGVLSGGPFLQDLKSMYKHPDLPSLTTHVFIAVDPECFIPYDEYLARVSKWVEMIKGVPMVEEGSSQLIPGEIEHRTEQDRKQHGIPVPQEVLKELKSQADLYGVSWKI